MKTVRFDVTDEIWKLAENRCKNMPVLRGSRQNGKENVVGAVGTIIVERYYKGSVWIDTSESDLLFMGKTLEVKTRTLEVNPFPTIEFLLPKIREQDSMYYVFVGLSKKNNIAWILGYLPRYEVFKKAEFIPKGTKIGMISNTLWNNWKLTFGQFYSPDILFNAF